jgi:hypothetical protein
MQTPRTAVNVIRRISNRYRVHVLVANDGTNRIRAQAVCSCRKFDAPRRCESDPNATVMLASDDAFHHHCSTGHRMATPRVRASWGSQDVRGAL